MDQKAPATIGRPREFDADEALDRALEVFWRDGYEGATIAHLTDAMGINPPSLYAAFGNKRSLFRKALDRYAETRVGYWKDALTAPTARGMVEHLLRECAEFLTDRNNPHGCLMVRGALSCSEAAADIQRELTQRRRAAEADLRQRLKSARAAGELPQGIEPAEFARYVMTVMDGMAVRAAGGATRAELRKVAEMALRAWPE